jgi:enhancing lycopene biosynthesis protein 2
VAQKKRIGVVLSGCGVFDGSEIHEAVLTLYFLDCCGAEAVCMAPDIDQYHVVDHLAGQPVQESRRVLVESARIARGKICPLESVVAADLDGIILPGGFGAAKNLSDLALGGATTTVYPPLVQLLTTLHRERKPIGAICIAPAVVAQAFAGQGITLTIGNDAQTAEGIRQAGHAHQESRVDEIVVDETHRVITTSAYMCATGIREAASGIERLVSAVVERA